MTGERFARISERASVSRLVAVDWRVLPALRYMPMWL